jgi:integrase
MTTFAKQADIYLAGLRARKREPVKVTSLVAFKSRTRAATPVLGNMRLEAVDNGALKTLAAILCDKQYESNSIHAILKVVKQVVASDLDKNGNPRQPRKWNMKFIDAPSPESAEVTPPTREDLENALRVSRSPLWQFMATQAASGLRKGELCALTVDDFDSQIGLLHVSRTLSRYGETSAKTKTGKRDVDPHPDITAMLMAMLAGRATGRLFDLTIDAVRWGYDNLKIRTHSLRHYRYTHLDKFPLSPGIRDFWIGHSSAILSATYSHIKKDIELRQRLVREVGLGFSLPTVAAMPEPALEPEMVSA